MAEDIRNERLPPSCAQCRRKKVACDRRDPCSPCTKAKLMCSYEKVFRTPLTRKYLTEVELELERTKALLEEYQKGTSPESGEDDRNLVQDVHSPSSHRQARKASSAQLPTPSTSTGTVSRSIRSPVNRQINDIGLELAPTGDLDWDERNSNIRFTDGMASLIDRRNGYMGVASGAALMRIAEDSSDDNLEVNNDHYRVTPPLPALYSLSQLEPFVDAYFATYHVSYPIVHEPSFRAQFMEVVPRPHGSSWQVLLHIIAAIGCFAASEQVANADAGLFDAAKQRMSIDMLETGNITLVQALTLISNYVQKRNRPNSGYNYMGLAKRMAWGLALHKEFPTWKDQPFRLELRRRVWWCLYIFDVGAIITFSRPLDMPADGIEVNLPLNIHDSDLTASTAQNPQVSDATTLYTHVRCQSQFHISTNDIYQLLISTVPSAEEMLELDESRLQSWLQEIPSYFAEDTTQLPKFRLCHAILQWRWRNFRILMFRPYLMRRFVKQKHNPNRTTNPDYPLSSTAEQQAIHTCLTTAQDSIHKISQFWTHERQNVLTCWYALYFLFQAVLVTVISLRNDSRSPSAPMWRDTILEALDTIADMARLNPAATRCHAAIMKLCGAYLAADVAQWESPADESPQTQMNMLYPYMFGPMADEHLFDGLELQHGQGQVQGQEGGFLDFMGLLGAP